MGLKFYQFVRDHNESIHLLASESGAGEVRFFTSEDWDSENNPSEVFAVAEFSGDKTLLDHAALGIELERLLGCKVRVASKRGLRPRVEQALSDRGVPPALDDLECLRTIADTIAAVQKYSDLGKEVYERNEMVQVWVNRHLHNLRLVARRTSPDLRRAHPEIDWQQFVNSESSPLEKNMAALKSLAEGMNKDSTMIELVRQASARIKAFGGDVREKFESDELVRIWTVHHLQIIAEACAGLSPEVAPAFKTGYLHRFAVVSDIIEHGFDDLDMEEVWNTIAKELVPLERALSTLEIEKLQP